ncbi:MAG: hypothetical protein C4539_06750 [Ignavibacteriales bacterium]|nr:MAG: hypothetical protein C4539_06750 [Ignavibacteriales bacterium]
MGKADTNNSKIKKEMYLLLDKLPQEEISGVKRYLQYVIDKAQEERLNDILENAPIDDEPLTKREIKAIETSMAQIARGEYITFEQYLKKRNSK